MSTILHEVQRHYTDKALNSKSGENIANSAIATGEQFLSGIHTWMVILGVVVIVTAFIAWNLVGKGEGSHAGREEVRRSYRRKLAQEMAKQDAEKIKRGEKPRRRWMQW